MTSSWSRLCVLVAVLAALGLSAPEPDLDPDEFPDLALFLTYWSASWYSLNPVQITGLVGVFQTWKYLFLGHGGRGLERRFAHVAWPLDLSVVDFLEYFREVLPPYLTFVQKGDDLWFPVLRAPTKRSHLDRFAQFVHDQLSEAYRDLTGAAIDFGDISARTYSDSLLLAQYDKIWNDVRQRRDRLPKWQFHWRGALYTVWLPERDRCYAPRTSVLDDVDTDDLLSTCLGPAPSRSLSDPIVPTTRALKRTATLSPMPTVPSPNRASPSRPKSTLSRLMPVVFGRRQPAPVGRIPARTSQSGSATPTNSVAKSVARAAKSPPQKPTTSRPAVAGCSRRAGTVPAARASSSDSRSPSDSSRKAGSPSADPRPPSVCGSAPPAARSEARSAGRSFGVPGRTAVKTLSMSPPAPKAARSELRRSSTAKAMSPSGRTDNFFVVYIPRSESEYRADAADANVVVPAFVERDDTDPDLATEFPDLFGFMALVSSSFAVNCRQPASRKFPRTPSAPLRADLASSPTYRSLRAAAPLTSVGDDTVAYPVFAEFLLQNREKFPESMSLQSLIAYSEDKEAFAVFRMPQRRRDLVDFDAFVRTEVKALGDMYFGDFCFTAGDARAQFAEIVAMFDEFPAWSQSFNKFTGTVTMKALGWSTIAKTITVLLPTRNAPPRSP